MKYSSLQSVVFLFFFMVLSCAPAKRVVVQQAPRVIEKERIISKSFDAVWQTSIEWFATHNTPIKNLDKSSGLISTEYSVSIGEAQRYMQCGAGSSTFSGKVEMSNYTGNFNVLIKKLGDNSTKISVNVFFGCTINKYRYKSLISTEYILESSTRTNCVSTGTLEKEILDYIEAMN
ncbi:MAG: hypothetical protein K2Q21_11470 [Chitinophagaceae bacterium]|nr:hypothetical protein [Chitinophagaceae bacterium]